MIYRAAGLTIAATQIIPGLALARAAPADPPDVTIFTGIEAPWSQSAFTPHYSSDDTDARGVANITVLRAIAGFHFHYADETRFWIDAGGRHVWMTWETTFEDACTYLVGPVLAFVLRVRGALALHASAVQVGDRALALVGPHGAGKSTAAAALGRRCCPVITDDVLRLTRDGDRWLAHPFGGVLRLWPGAETLLFGSTGRLPRITASWEKRALPLGAFAVSPAEAPIPLGAIAFLDTPAVCAPGSQIVAVPPGAALLRLSVNSSATHLLDASQRAVEFSALASVAQCTPCVAAVGTCGGSEPDEFFDRLLAWARTRAVEGAA